MSISDRPSLIAAAAAGMNHNGDRWYNRYFDGWYKAFWRCVCVVHRSGIYVLGMKGKSVGRWYLKGIFFMFEKHVGAIYVRSGFFQMIKRAL